MSQTITYRIPGFSDYDFEWDETKQASNRAKHGIDFRDAAAAFLKPSGTYTIQDDRFDYGETRLVTYAMIGRKLATIVHTERPTGLRIISARWASTNEQNHYRQAAAER